MALGHSVTSSSNYFSVSNNNYRLDYDITLSRYVAAWGPAKAPGAWIQVFSEQPKFFTAIIIRGRGSYPQWTTKIKISYSLNGHTW